MALKVKVGDCVVCCGNLKHYPAVVTALKPGKVGVTRWDTSKERFLTQKWIPEGEVVRVIQEDQAARVYGRKMAKGGNR